MLKRSISCAAALALVFGAVAYLPGGFGAQSAITAQASLIMEGELPEDDENAETVSFTFIIKDKTPDVAMSEWKFGFGPNGFPVTDNGDGTYTKSVTAGKETAVSLSMPEVSYDFRYTLSSDNGKYYLSQWKDIATGKIYDNGDIITPDKDMAFEGIWNKTRTITYDSSQLENGKLTKYRTENIKTSIGVYDYDYDIMVMPSMIGLTKEPEVSKGMDYYWHCVGDSSGKLYKYGDEIVLTSDMYLYPVWYYGWNEDSQGKWYLNKDLTYPVNKTVTIDGVKYTFDKSGYLTKTKLSNCKATLSKTSYTYNGKARKPAVIVKNGKTTLKKGTDYTVTYKNNTKVGKATVTIKGKGNYTGTVTKTFKINPKATSVSKLTSPKTKQLKVTYKKVSGVTGYQVTYSTSKKFTKATTKTATVKGAAKLSKTVKSLKKGKTYYVKVRSYKTVSGTKYYSTYSAVKKVKTK
ncbi:MAG: hypothetical protein IJ740_15210 [Ruminococcus sp.]|nr:hypothetical protein [Ruminococcus sp.]